MLQEKHDIDAIPGERWFPKETSFKDEMKVLWGDWGVSSEVNPLKAVLMRRPGREIENFDYRQVRFKAPVDPELIRRQHDELASIYRAHGVRVYYVEEQLENRPNALFMRDLMFMTPEGAIVTRPAMSERRGEEKAVHKTLADLGVPILQTIHGDGIFEGANAMWVDRETVILATGSRTNRSGYEQVETTLRRLGVTQVVHMQIPYGHAHIDGLLNLASHETAMIHPPQVPYDVCHVLISKGFKILETPSQTEAKETFGVNFVAIKPGLVVQPEGNPRCREVLEENGVKVIPVEVGEIMKGWGAIHCVTAFLKRGED
jgi:N-dimethylarginine dimethylaminohydrolase